MNTEIKTTVYDIFGYLLPGYIFCALAFIGYHHFIGSNTKCIVSSATKAASSLKLYNFLAISAIAYVIGHLFSAFSSFLIKDLLIEKKDCFGKYRDSEEILGKDLYYAFCQKVRNTFNVIANDRRTFRLCLCYVEAKQPVVYSTALVFLSINGMARTLALITFLFSICEIINLIVIKDSVLFWFVIASIAATFGFFYQSLRFYKYFNQRILIAFLLPNNLNHK